MKLNIDTDSRTLSWQTDSNSGQCDLYSTESFERISNAWLKVGWNQKYPYTFSWLGRPFIQIPEDMLRMQEVIYTLKPDVIIETGIAHGGSIVFSASMCKLIGKGRVIGVDIDIRQTTRTALETHELFPYITMIEGSSTALEVVAKVKSHVKAAETVLVILDSCHTKQHVLDELNAYHDLVTDGSYIVATDGSMRDLHDVPRGSADWTWNHPAGAAEDFAKRNTNFKIEQPAWSFNESELKENITHWPHAWLKRVS
jgi:cephalosporin hydroxylase